MADNVELSVVLRAVDKWTAGVDAFNKRLDEITKRLDGIGKVGQKAGVSIFDGFDRVGGAFKKVGGAVKDLIGKMLGIGGAVGVATAGVLHLVGEFDDLGDKAERMGVGVDFLAAMRFAAERSGAEVQDLDNGMQAFLANVGAAKANKGSLFKFLSVVSPDLLKQIKTAKTGEQAFMRFADGMAALSDQEKKLALAEKSGLGPALVPLLSRGSKGLRELQGAHTALAGSLEKAASGAGEVDDSLKNLKASTTGVEAALVAGLAPALKDIIDKLSAWLVDHRGDIAQWAKDIGEKLPGAVQGLVQWVGNAFDKIEPFIEQLGGWNVAAGALATVIAGPLVAAVAALGIALVATPFGQVLLGLTAITAAILKLTGATEGFESVAERLGFKTKKPGAVHGGVPVDAEFEAGLQAMMADGRRAAQIDAAAQAALDANPAVQQARLLQDQNDAMLAFPDPFDAARAQNASFTDARVSHVKRIAELNDQIEQFSRQHPGPQEAKVTIDINNAPKGTTVTTDPRSTADVSTNVGYTFGGGVW